MEYRFTTLISPSVFSVKHPDAIKEIEGSSDSERLSEGEKRRGLSAHSPSPRAKHPKPRSRIYERLRIHEKPRRPPERDGEENG